MVNLRGNLHRVSRAGNITPEDILKYLGSTSELTLVNVNSAMVLKDSSGGLYYTDWDYGTDKGNNIDTTKTVKWYIVYGLADKDNSLKQKLEARMTSAGLVNKRPGKYNLNSSKEEYCFGLLVEDFTQ